jgi:hypothetical protein
MVRLTRRTGDAAIRLDSQHSGFVELFCEAPGNRTGPVMDLGRGEIVMSTVGRPVYRESMGGESPNRDRCGITDAP